MSKCAYSTIEAAEKASGSFLERCKHSDKNKSQSLFDLDNDAKVVIQEFELVEED